MEAQFFIREGCTNLPLPCPDPLVWLVAGLFVGLWLASSLWLVYIDYTTKQEKETGDDE